MARKIVSYTEREGGHWIKFPSNVNADVPSIEILHEAMEKAISIDSTSGKVFLFNFEFTVSGQTKHITLHAFRTSDDRIWDCVNGWRPV